MRQAKLTKQERAIEAALLKDEYKDLPARDFETVAKAIAARRKDAVLNIRVNSRDLDSIKHKAKKLGIKYQTFIAELIHRLAEV